MVWAQLEYQGTPYTINMSKVLAIRPIDRAGYSQLIFEHPTWTGERKMSVRMPYEELAHYMTGGPDPLNTYDNEGLGNDRHS